MFLKPLSKILADIGYEILPHQPYSPDLFPTDYQFFKHLEVVLRNKQYSNSDAVVEAFKQFISSKDNFFRNGIYLLVSRWQKTVEANGAYYE